MLTIILFYALMAGVFTFGKQVVLYAYPFFLTALRLPIVGGIFILYARWYEKHSQQVTATVAKLLFGYALAVLFMDSGRFYALQTLPAANTALITSLAPFAAALLSYLFLGEKMTVRKMVILGVGFLGMMPLLVGHARTPLEGDTGNLLFAYSAAFCSMLGFVLIGVFIKLLTKKHNFPMFLSIGYGMLWGGIMALGCSLISDPWNPMPFLNASRALPIIGYLLITHNLMAYPIYAYLLQHYPLTLIAFAQLLTPLFTALLRWAMFGEMISLPFVISFSILSGALYLFYREEDKEGLIT